VPGAPAPSLTWPDYAVLVVSLVVLVAIGVAFTGALTPLATLLTLAIYLSATWCCSSFRKPGGSASRGGGS
jgi:hypothetical protein